MNSAPLRYTLATFGLLAALGSQGGLALAGTSGGMAGTVTDSKTGAPVAGVRLRVSSPSQAATTTTDAKGHYLFFSLQPDDYTITAVKDGYATQSISGESVYADQTQQYDLHLTPVPAAAASPGL